MALSSEQFLNQVVASELMAQEDISAFISAIPDDRRPKDGEQLARELVRHKKLTKYQAEQIYSGKGKTLILGNYVVLDKLGQGGMGVVLKAEHKRLKRLVALKVMSSNLVKTPDSLKRFHREVEAAAKLRHTNVVATDDADEAKGTHFLVMEYVEGSDLSALVKKNGPLSVSQAVQCILQAARGLEYAHKQGVVHRDIKPANLLLDTSGTVKILDMGLARIEGDSGSQGELTSTGAVMGTVDYMAPEQAMSTKHADARSDIYSLGISLWYLLAGRCAYEGDSMMAKLLAHRDAPIPSLCSVDSEIPAALDAVFRKMVAKQAKDRYQSMTEVIRDLESCRSGSQSAPDVAAPNSFEDPSLQSFLSQLGGSPSSSTASTASRKTTEPATRVKINPAAEATMLNGNIGVDTDPQTMMSIRKQERQTRRGNRAAEVQAASPPWYLDRRILFGGAAAAALILVAVVILMRTPHGTLRVEILDPDVEMKVKGTEVTFRATDIEPVSLVTGDKKLVVTRGDLTFETDTFTLKKGTETRVKVELIGDKVVVNRDGDVIAEKAVGRTSITSSTTMTATEPPGHPIGVGNASGSFSAGSQRRQSLAALQFDGNATTLVEIPSLRVPRGGPLTFEGYFTPTSDTVQEINQVFGCPFNALFINHHTQNWSFVWQYGDGTSTTCTGPRFVKGQRTHVAGVVSRDFLRLFIDGKRVETKPLDPGGQTALQELSELTLGSAFHGLIDNVRVSKTARYFLDFTPAVRLVPDEESLLCFDFTEGQGEQLRDSSGSGHHGKIVGAKWVKSAESPPTSAVTANSIDLLTLVDVQRDAGVGNWERIPDGIACENSNGANVLQLPYEPPEEYDFEVEFTATANGLNVNQYIAAGGSTFAWKLNSHGVNPPLYGFELLDGKFAKDNKEAAVQIPDTIKTGQRYRSTVEVRRGALRTLLDGKELVNWSGDFKRFSVEAVTPMKHPGRIGIGSWRRPVTFHSIKVREISGSGRITATSSEKASASTWIDWLGPAIDQGLFGRSGWSREKDGVTTDQTIIGEEVLPKETRNGAIRATYLLRNSRGIQLSARARNSQFVREFNYFAEDNGDKIQIASMTLEKEYKLLGELDVPKSIPRDAPRTLEFRVVDDVLTLTLNSSLVLTVKDSTQSEGLFAVAALKGLLIQKVEIQRLDSSSPDGQPGSTLQPLFNGKDLNGWKVIGVDGWTVENGVLIGRTDQGKGSGWLMTERVFENYQLELEYKLSPGSNSGLFPRAFPTGDVSGKDFVEIQLLDDNAPNFASVPADKKTGSIFGRFAPQPAPIVPPNQWHRVKMVVRGQNVSLEINDVVVVKQGLPDLPLTGHIGLQLYPTQVEFRNLRIRP